MPQNAGTPDSADAAERDSSTALPGQYIPPHPGQDGQLGNEDDYIHLPEGATMPICTADQLSRGDFTNPLCYPSNPPTSGPHSPMFVRFQFYSSPIAKEMLVHNMEHGGVIIWYNTANQATIDSIRAITDGANGSRYSVVASPYAAMEPDTIALTSWTRLDKFPVSEFTPARAVNFIMAHSKRFNPEGF
jgi:hypothetical protein